MSTRIISITITLWISVTLYSIPTRAWLSLKERLSVVLLTQMPWFRTQYCQPMQYSTTLPARVHGVPTVCITISISVRLVAMVYLTAVPMWLAAMARLWRFQTGKSTNARPSSRLRLLRQKAKVASVRLARWWTRLTPMLTERKIPHGLKPLYHATAMYNQATIFIIRCRTMVL